MPSPASPQVTVSIPTTPPPANGPHVWLAAVWKHRWLVLVGSSAGLLGAAAIGWCNPPRYHSTASLLVRYATGGEAAAPDSSQPERANRVILTEIAILTSQDLALQTASRLNHSPRPILANHITTPLPPDAAAAAELLNNLTVTTGYAGNILRLTYADPDATKPKELLRTLIECYFARHLEVHRSPAAFELVSQQTESAAQALHATETELNQLRTEAGLLDLDDATNPLATQRAHTQTELLAARTQRAALEAKIASLQSTLPHSEPLPTQGPNPSPEAISEYHSLTELIPFLRKRELELRLKFPPGHRLLALNQSQLTQYESRQRHMLQQFPALLTLSQQDPADPTPSNPALSLVLERANLAASQAKISILEHHLVELTKEFSSQYAVGNRIDQLTRTRDRQEADFRELDAKLKQARTDLALNPEHLPNITVLESPTDPVMAQSPTTRKWIAAAASAGLAASVAIAILLELSQNRRIRYPSEIHHQLRLPLLLTVPWVPKKLRHARLAALPAPPPDQSADDKTPQPHTPPSLPPSHFILPFTHQLRDRLALHFRLHHIHHKPKLIALCGVTPQAGTSTLAAGLAASLAEIPAAKVLLVDLASSAPGDSPLFGQLPRLSLHKALDVSQSEPFQTSQQQLFLATPTPTHSGPQHTALQWIDLLPELRQSPYDYVVFDLPAASDPSDSLLTARLMDMVLLVLDAETTRHQALVEAFSQLQQQGTQVSCILNKSRTDLPPWLRPPLLQPSLMPPPAAYLA